MGYRFIPCNIQNPISYHVGDTVHFSLRLANSQGMPASCHTIRWRMKADGAPVQERVLSGSETAAFTCAVTAVQPGYIRLYVAAYDEAGVLLTEYKDGAIASLYAIKPAGQEPPDFDAYWAAAMEEIRTVPLQTSERVPVFPEHETHAIWDIKLPMPAGRPVSGYLCIPRNALPHSLPATAVFMGYGVAASSLMDLQPDRMTLIVNAHGLPNNRPPAFYEELKNGELRDFAFSNPRDEELMRQMIQRDVVGTRFLCTLPEWNGRVLTAQGGSMGAMQATAVAALSGVVTRLCIDIPWMTDIAGVSCGREKGWLPTETALKAMYDTTHMAQRITCPVDITAGLADEVCPPSGAAALFGALSVPRSLTFYPRRGHADPIGEDGARYGVFVHP